MRLIRLLSGAILFLVLSQSSLAQVADEVDRALQNSPVLDGHNDAPWQYRKRVRSRLDAMPFHRSTKPWGLHTDLPRLRKGKVGAQFWSAFVPQGIPNQVQAVRNQINLIKKLTAQNPEMVFVNSKAGVEQAFREGKIASLIGVEGGHALGGRMDNLRVLYRMGTRYMTLTHSKSNALGDSSTGRRRYGGLSKFGKSCVKEMNRLGMIVDISHVSDESARDALKISKAPVLFTHSNSRALCQHERNVPDDILKQLQKNGGVIMVSFVPSFVSESVRRKQARNGRLSQVADHIDHIKELIGVEHIGIGADFDGISFAVAGLEDVSKYPALFRELAKRGYTQGELEAISSRNVLRVLGEVEAQAQ